MKPRKPIKRSTTPLKRGNKPLKRSPAPKRKKAVPKVNAKRAKKAFEANYGAKAGWIRTLPCCVTGLKAGEWIAQVPSDDTGGVVLSVGSFHQAVIVAHHVRSRGAGGSSANLVPLESDLHQALHAQGTRTFEAIYGVDLRTLATEFEQRWQAEHPAPEGRSPKEKREE